MAVALTSVVIQMDLSGWTDVSADVDHLTPVTITYGCRGGGPADRVADVGEMNFALLNMQDGARPSGYYSPGHANARAGFGLGIGVRIAITYSAVTYYKFLGTIKKIVPMPSKAGRVTLVTVADWMYAASRARMPYIQAVENTKAGAHIAAVVAGMTAQPNATDLDEGDSVFRFAPVGTAGSVLAELQRTVMSDMGRLFVSGGTSAAAAGTLRYFSRSAFVQSPLNTSQITLTDNEIFGLAPELSPDMALNLFRGTAHPRQSDPTSEDPVVLYSLSDPISVDPGETIVIEGKYVDPSQQASAASGHGMVTPINSTDYKFNSNPNGEATDLDADFDLVTSFGPDRARFEITNNGAVSGWVAKLQVRGYGSYDYEPVVVEESDAASIAANEENPVDIDFWYLTDPTAVQLFIRYMLEYWKDAVTTVQSVMFEANDTNALMVAALAREPGDKITVQETRSGLNRAFHINGVHLTIYSKQIQCAWALTPQVDTNTYWVLGTSVLGTDTVPFI